MGALEAVLDAPPQLLGQVAATRQARALLARVAALEDAAFADGVEWGVGVEGQVPPNRSGWKTTDKPLRAHLRALALEARVLLGEDREEVWAEQQRAQVAAFRRSLRGSA